MDDHKLLEQLNLTVCTVQGTSKELCTDQKIRIRMIIIITIINQSINQIIR